MPRGIYDRSKLKKSHKHESTETVAHTAAPKGKPGRKPGRKPGNSVATASASVAKSTGNKATNTMELLSEVRQNLATLSSLKQQFGTIGAINTEVQAHVELLGRLSREAFGVVETVTEVKQAVTPPNGLGTVTNPMPVVQLPPNITTSLPTTQS